MDRAPSQDIFASWSPFSINPATGQAGDSKWRTFHSSLSYRFPEIAEAIDLDLFKSLNDFGIQARGGSVRSDLQEARAGSSAEPGLPVAGR